MCKGNKNSIIKKLCKVIKINWQYCAQNIQTFNGRKNNVLFQDIIKKSQLDKEMEDIKNLYLNKIILLTFSRIHFEFTLCYE